MKLEQSFEVKAPTERVFSVLVDIERVVPCLPGAALTGHDDEGNYDGTFSVKIGPTTASYSGKLKVEQVDEETHSAQLQANGTDRRGQGGARATITSSVQESDGGARVDVVTDYHITGRLARFGRGGMIEDVAGRLLKEFAQCLQASLADGGESETEPSGAETATESGQAQTDTETAAQTVPPAASSFTPPPASEPLQGGSLIASVALDRARRNPAGVAAVVAGLLVLLALVRRRR